MYDLSIPEIFLTSALPGFKTDSDMPSYLEHHPKNYLLMSFLVTFQTNYQNILQFIMTIYDLAPRPRRKGYAVMLNDLQESAPPTQLFALDSSPPRSSGDSPQLQ